ncbi:xanthine dehydrogenase family protein subunit M [Neobacillus niacini]|uniref:FAD binding domain-containing protein n=1 Tax=Neobacillus niacini TaxID=86668 RepID=UPI002FFF0448
MKPAVFSYLRPTNLQQALNYLEEYGEDSKILSGGQSLIPTMNMRLSAPAYLIDISRIKELNYIRQDGDFLAVGALTKHKDIEHSDLVKEVCPLLAEAIKWVGHAQIRNRGTVGGSIAHGDPSAELPCVLTALRGEIVIANVDGSEEVLVPEEFFLTYMLTSLQPDQMVKEVRFPIISKQCRSAFVEVARRHGDFGLAMVAAVVDLNEDGSLSNVKIAVGGVNPTPTVLEEVEHYLVGKKLTDNVLEHVSTLTEESVDPETDLHGTAEYRRELAAKLTVRAIKIAVERAKEGEKHVQ